MQKGSERNESSYASSATETTSPPNRWLNRTVVGTGITSALGDFC
ncbi:hypothetical protein [Vreelandella andesensis]|nr:hypothetical protein [Halomonas andesensis]